jgi:hypothetical protein
MQNTSNASSRIPTVLRVTALYKNPSSKSPESQGRFLGVSPVKSKISYTLPRV